jgi:hypothetical protein
LLSVDCCPSCSVSERAKPERSLSVSSRYLPVVRLPVAVKSRIKTVSGKSGALSEQNKYPARAIARCDAEHRSPRVPWRRQKARRSTGPFDEMRLRSRQLPSATETSVVGPPAVAPPALIETPKLMPVTPSLVAMPKLCAAPADAALGPAPAAAKGNPFVRCRLMSLRLLGLSGLLAQDNVC